MDYRFDCLSSLDVSTTAFTGRSIQASANGRDRAAQRDAQSAGLEIPGGA